MLTRKPTAADKATIRVRQGREIFTTTLILDESEHLQDVLALIDEGFRSKELEPPQWRRLGKVPE